MADRDEQDELTEDLDVGEEATDADDVRGGGFMMFGGLPTTDPTAPTFTMPPPGGSVGPYGTASTPSFPFPPPASQGPYGGG